MTGPLFPVPTALLLCPLLPLWDPWMMKTWWTRRGLAAVPCDKRVRCQAVQKSQKLMWHPTKGWVICGAILLLRYIVLLVSSPSLHWRLCRPCAGVFALVALLSLSSMRLLHHCLCRAGVSTVVVLPLLPLLRWHLYPCCAGIFAGILHRRQ